MDSNPSVEIDQTIGESELPNSLEHQNEKPIQSSLSNAKSIVIVIAVFFFVFGVIYLFYIQQFNSWHYSFSPSQISLPTTAPRITTYRTNTYLPNSSPTPNYTGAHYFMVPQRPIQIIYLTTVYYATDSSRVNPNWKIGIDRNIDALKAFFERELGHKVSIVTENYSSPIISSKQHNLVRQEDPNQYVTVCAQETLLAKEDILSYTSPKTNGDLNLWAIVFQDLNCSIAGQSDTLLVPGYIIDNALNASQDVFTGLLISHEFGHLLGMPDIYNSAPESYIHNGISEKYCTVMGHCKEDKIYPLNVRFLSDTEKRGLGIIRP